MADSAGADSHDNQISDIAAGCDPVRDGCLSRGRAVVGRFGMAGRDRSGSSRLGALIPSHLGLGPEHDLPCEA